MTNKFKNYESQKTLAQTNVVTQADANGEIINTTTEHVFKIHSASEPHYIKQYQQDFDAFNALKKSSKEVLQELLTYTTYNENMLYLNIAIKKTVCKKLGIAYQTITNALSELKKSQILLYLDTGLYIVNPYYYGLGEWSKLRKLRNNIKVKVESRIVNSKSIEIYTFDYQQLKDGFIDKTKLESAKPKETPFITNKVKIERMNKVKLKKRFSNFMKIFKSKNTKIQS